MSPPMIWPVCSGDEAGAGFSTRRLDLIAFINRRSTQPRRGRLSPTSLRARGVTSQGRMDIAARLGLEVNVRPAQARDLTAPQARQRQLPGMSEAVFGVLPPPHPPLIRPPTHRP